MTEADAQARLGEVLPTQRVGTPLENQESTTPSSSIAAETENAQDPFAGLREKFQNVDATSDEARGLFYATERFRLLAEIDAPGPEGLRELSYKQLAGLEEIIANGLATYTEEKASVDEGAKRTRAPFAAAEEYRETVEGIIKDSSGAVSHQDAFEALENIRLGLPGMNEPRPDTHFPMPEVDVPASSPRRGGSVSRFIQRAARRP